jgi:translation initiation factor 6 (eIF-6)
MATRVAFENSNEIGVFCALTNGYCLTGKILWFPETRTTELDFCMMCVFIDVNT